MSALVLDQPKRPVMRCCEKRPRPLLERGRAVVHHRYPFTIRLKDRVGGDVESVRGKPDRGSRTTSIAVVAEEDGNRKDARPIEEFLAGRPALLAHIEAQGAAQQRRRRQRHTALSEALADTGLPVEASSGGRTKFNR